MVFGWQLWEGHDFSRADRRAKFCSVCDSQNANRIAKGSGTQYGMGEAMPFQTKFPKLSTQLIK
jgi:hypothetical protein